MKWQRLIHHLCQPLRLHVCEHSSCQRQSSLLWRSKHTWKEKQSVSHRAATHRHTRRVQSGSALEGSAALGQVKTPPPRRRMFNGSCEDMWVQLLRRQQYHCTGQKPFGTKHPVISSACAGFDLVALHDARASCHLTLQPKYTRTPISTEK